MSFYRSILAVVAAVAITSPVFADVDASAPGNTTQAATTQLSDNSNVSAKDNAAVQQQGTEALQSKININKAKEKELIKVKGLNASKAKAIVKYRKKHGDFKSLDTLVKVKGFSKLKADDLKSIEDQLTVE